MTASPSSGNRSTDDEAVLRILGQILAQLETQQQQQQARPSDDSAKKALSDSLHALGSISSPSLTTSLLAPLLFSPPSAAVEASASEPAGDTGAPPLDSKRALAVMTYLVATDPTTYLKPASRSVRSAAEELGTPAVAVPPTDTSATTTGVAPPSAAERPAPSLPDETLAVVVSQLAGSDVESADNAAGTLVAASRNLGPPTAVRCVRSVAESWGDVARRAEDGSADVKRSLSTVAIRCASATVDLACLGDAPMDAAIASGSARLLLDVVSDGTDPLLQVSALDLLERMASTLPMHGNRARWLFGHEVLAPLLGMAGGGDGDPDPILGGPAIRALSSFCKLGHSAHDASLFGLGGSELLKGFHQALHRFEESSSGEIDRLAFIDAVSSFASASSAAMTLVLDDPVLREGWLSLNVAQPKLKSVVLHSVATTINPPSEVDSNGDTVVASSVPSNQASMELFEALGSVNGRDATDLVLSAANSAMPETRLGAYALLKAVAKRGTGAQVLLSHDNFFEFLVTREKETTKEGKEAKHEIVEAVLASDARMLLTDTVVETLEKIVTQGPHFVHTVPWELATE